MKSYTDLKQSEILSKILKHESADMSYYIWKDDGHLMSLVPFVLDGTEEKEDGMFEYIPCWSLTALYALLPEKTDISKAYSDDCVTMIYWCWTIISESEDECGTITETSDYDNPTDACVEMVIKLHEQNLL